MLLFKGSSGHVETSFDKTAKNFPVKLQVFLVKVQEKRKTNFSRVFLTFFALYTWLLFRHTWLFFFDKIRKKLTRSPKRDDDSINYFCHFFSKFCWGHVNCTFSNTAKCHTFFVRRRFFSLRDRKRSNKYSSLQKKTSKRSVSPVGCTFESFWQKIHTKSPILSLNDQKTWAKFLHSRETS